MTNEIHPAPKAGEQPTITQADILATEFDRIRLAFDSVNRDRDRLKAIVTCLRVNAIKGQDPEALLAFMRDGLDGIDAGLTIGEMIMAYEPANTRTTPLAAQLDERIVHVSGTNPMSSETIQHLNVIANAACEAIHPAPSTSTPDEPASSIEFQQRRGRAADLIDWALNEYDGFMVDDDYDSQRLLDRIAERFRAFRHDNLETPHE